MLKPIRNYYSSFFAVTAIVFFNACSQKLKPATTSEVKTLTFAQAPMWADEFDTDGKPDTTKWSYDIGGHGWGNNELQYYTQAENVQVKNGLLIIEARKETKENKHYTSSRMVSKNKADFLYGRFEARAKIPNGRGLWPAIWMLPTDWAYGDWPQSGEIDIMEQVGFESDKLHISVHTEKYNHIKGTQKTATTIIPRATEGFHLYRVDWTPEDIKGYIDNQLIFSFANEHKSYAEWPFDKRFHWILNIAVGGNWGGMKGVDNSIFPATLQIDYVRVYKLQQ